MSRKVAAGALKCASAFLWMIVALAGPLSEPKCSLTFDEMNCINATIGDLPRAMESPAKDVKFLESKIPILKNGDLFSFPKLTDFVCLDCQLSVIERGAFSTSKNLITLELYGNNLTLIDATIVSNSPKIKDCVISWNPGLILKEDQPFLISSTLTSLDLTGNDLTAIFSVTFSRLPALKSLSLASNALQHLPQDALAPLKNLRAVDLSRNKIRALPLSIFPSRVNRARLSWNPWKCDCSLYPLIQWFKTNKLQEEVRCFQPRGIKWRDFQPSNCTTEFIDAIRQRKLMSRSIRS